MITILYFASIREHMGKAKETVELTENITTVEALIRHLSETNSAFNQLCQSANSPLISVNQVFAEPSSPIVFGDEVGFFPSMTGG
ncbi:MAG TPA: molybdopterin synthase sulfur carrier subunit [Gammaproteobacteria bacterium]|nr:molybdopterin synthase sulfur carrier subunit [Gammaproteobacteria bacterium]|tara:strand:- start:963 stop:1217 length:255 start_codon:yes stop_codon:yes gene_type:complete